VKTIKKINYKIIIAALVTGLLVFILAFADPKKGAADTAEFGPRFHDFVSNRLLYNGLEALDLKITDTIYQPDWNTALDIWVIGIDSETQDELGPQSSWQRDKYAELLDNLHKDGYSPAVVCFDILFSGEKDPEKDKLFADTCAKYGDTIQGVYFNYGLRHVYEEDNVHYYEESYIKKIDGPYADLAAVTKQACTNNDISADGYARTVFVDRMSDEPVDSLALAAYKAYLEYNGENYVPHKYIADKKQNTIYFTYSTTLNKNSKPFSYRPFYEALTDENLAQNCDGTIVFVGAYDVAMSDDFFTPAGKDKMYGVDIHANTCEAIAQGKLYVPANRTTVAIVYSILSVLLVFFVYLSALPIAISASVGAIALDFIANWIARKNGVYLPIVYFVVPAFIVIVTATVLHYLAARAEKAKINNAFKMYVAPEVVDEMAGSGSYELKLGGQTKDIAVLFIDIRGFTTMSEGLHPEEVVSILNEYFGLVTDAIFKNKGTLDKFIGDAAMAVFNSPNDLDDYVYRAVHTAWDIALGSQELAQKLLDTHGRTINYGIGVNCGPATIGNIGSEFRMDFTAIGDTVNTSARLEANAKAGQILISQAVYDRVKDWIETEEIGTIPLKGKSNEIFVYNVINVKDKPGYIESRSESGKKNKRNRLNHGQI
jgi:adenylate cyclase